MMKPTKQNNQETLQQPQHIFKATNFENEDQSSNKKQETRL